MSISLIYVVYFLSIYAIQLLFNEEDLKRRTTDRYNKENL